MYSRNVGFIKLDKIVEGSFIFILDFYQSYVFFILKVFNYEDYSFLKNINLFFF